MPLLMFLNVMPLAAAWGLDSNYSNYEAGHFDAVASENMGAWLGWSFLVASIMCQLGLLNSTMMAAQRMLYYFLQTRYPKTFGEHAITAGRSKLFIYLWVDPTPGVPAGLILANGCVALLVRKIDLSYNSRTLLGCTALPSGRHTASAPPFSRGRILLWHLC